MKIGSSSHPLPPAADNAIGAPAARGASASTPAVAAVATDQVELSSAGASIQGLNSGGNDFDAAKVDAIRQAIRDGRFSVNAEAIADRLIADATALLGPRTH